MGIRLQIDVQFGGMPGTQRQRKAWLLAALFLAASVLAGCGDLSRALTDTARSSLSRGRVGDSPDEVASRPYFQLLASTANGKAVLILGNVQGDREIWYGKDGVALFLEHGRVVKTANLAANLDGIRIAGNNPFASGLQHVGNGMDFDAVEDWSPGFRYGIPVHSHLKIASTETIDILKKPRKLLRVDEERSSPATSWSGASTYWVDPDTGFIWKSRQAVAPGLTIEIVQLKPHMTGPR